MLLHAFISRTRSWLSDFRLYRYLIAMQVRAQWQYKSHLAIEIISSFLFLLLEFVAVLLYFQAFHSLAGWQVGEVALLAALISASFGLAELFGGGIDGFSSFIRIGDFDRFLLRPVGVLMQVISSDFRLRRFGRISQSVVVFALAMHLLPGLHWTLAKLLALLLGLLSGASIFICILLLGATMCFWTIETTELTNLFSDGGREMLAYPLSIYEQNLQRFFFFVIPIAFASFVPACYILARPLPFGLPSWLAFVSPLFALVFALVSLLAWRFGIQRYQSTGS
jgi:ABC-2 type transport system permease protein